MIKQEFEDIKDKLREWREERYITINMQLENFNTLMSEEYLELLQAKSILKDLEDIEKFPPNLFTNLYKELISEKIDAYCDMIVIAINSGKTYNEIFTFKVQHKDGTSEEIIYSVKTLCKDLKTLKIDPYKAVLETIKEISSRIGSYDKEIGKWIKDKIQPNLYKADYNIAMI